MPSSDIPDIASAPDASLHSTLHVAAFLGRTPRAIRTLVDRGLLRPCQRRGSLYFRAYVIKDYLKNADLFKSKKGIPHLQKGHTTNDKPTDG